MSRLLRLSARVGAGGVAGTSALALYIRGSEGEYRSIPESALPHTYEPDQIAAVWREHPRCALARLTTIGRRAVPFCARLLADLAVPPPDEALQAHHAARAVELRSLLVELGPTFIKFGQLLSIRPDVVPPAAVYELQKLCDSVPSYPTPDALRLIEAELGAPVASTFVGLDATTEPIAAASLGQVYRCRLREGGAEVALKVQRPDMIRAVSLDLYLLRRLMQASEWFKETVLIGVLGAAERTNFDVALLDSFARASYLELDYRQEARNLQRFADELVPLCRGQVHVPACHWAATSRKVIATEWIDGVQLAKSPPDVIQRLTAVGVDCFLQQLLVVGFFHSDPHPGNLLVDEQGRLVLIDFGLCAEIAAFDSRQLTSAIVHLMRADVEALIEDGVTLRFLPPDVDRAALVPPLRAIFEAGKVAAAAEVARRRDGSTNSAAAAAATTTAAAAATDAVDGGAAGGGGDGAGGDRLGSFGAMAKKRAQFSAISRDLNQIFFDFPFRVPEYFALITRALIVLEGIALTGDKDFDLFDAAYPLAAKHAAHLFGTKQLASMLGEATQAAAAAAVAAKSSSSSNSSTAKATATATVGRASAADARRPTPAPLRASRSGFAAPA